MRGEFWWRVKIRPDKSFFPGWVGWALRKIGLMKQKEYKYEESIEVTRDDDVTTIKPKE